MVDDLQRIQDISEHFDIPGTFIRAAPHGGGYINDTYLARYETASGPACFIHQRINHHVFVEPEKVMENIERVTRYSREQILLAGGNPLRETLNLVPARDGRSFYRIPYDQPFGGYWRTYLFI